ncbi:MAG TPA: CRISPR-associated protein Cas4 [Puia sp.]|nr:CRISPR-associated protein Cas4 [Puia sp.]
MFTATHIAYYHICKRKLWLFSNGISMEHTSDMVSEGRLIHEISYPQRAEKYTEISIGGSKIDFYDAKNKVIHEIKKSDSMEAAHEWQVKYYIWLLEQNGIEGVSGIIEYPKFRQTKEVKINEEDRKYLEEIIKQIKTIADDEQCPARLNNNKLCKKCSYYDFCYTDE